MICCGGDICFAGPAGLAHPQTSKSRAIFTRSAGYDLNHRLGRSCYILLENPLIYETSLPRPALRYPISRLPGLCRRLSFSNFFAVSKRAFVKPYIQYIDVFEVFYHHLYAPRYCFRLHPTDHYKRSQHPPTIALYAVPSMVISRAP